MKKCYFLLCLSFLIFSCEKDDALNQSELSENSETSPIELLEFQDVPQHVLNLINDKDGNLKNLNLFGNVNNNTTVFKVNEMKESTSYTFFLENGKSSTTEQDYYFDNLVIVGDNKSYIFRYKPTLEWIEKGKNFKTFTGTIIIFNPNGEKMAEIISVDGVQTNMEDHSIKSQCTYELDRIETLCVGDVCQQTYYYREVCTSGGSGSGGSGGGDGSSTPGDDDGSGGGSGGSGSGDPGSIPTIPTDGSNSN